MDVNLIFPHFEIFVQEDDIGQVRMIGFGHSAQIERIAEVSQLIERLI